MIQIISIPAEQTTAATDVIMAILALYVTLKVMKAGRETDWFKTRIWVWAFGLLSFASATGAIAHGLEMSRITNFILWQPLNLALGISIGLFVAGVVYDSRAFSLPRMLIPFMMMVAVLFYTVTVLIPNAFFVFIVYEAVAMFYALIIYISLATRKKLAGANWMAAGILVTIIAAVIQSVETIKLNLIWEFDHNGLFHIVQMVALMILLKGLLTEFAGRKLTKTEG
jgi:hypothetical protein